MASSTLIPPPSTFSSFFPACTKSVSLNLSVSSFLTSVSEKEGDGSNPHVPLAWVKVALDHLEKVEYIDNEAED